MARVRNNQGYRKKILDVFIRPYLEQENTQEREGYLQAREIIKPLQDKTWELASKIVRRHYTPEDVKMAYHLQNKFENVNTIAKDSCFHFGYMSKKEGDVAKYEQEEYSGEHDEQDDKYITKHFDFRLDGNINGQESGRQNDFAYAYFRDELKGKVNKGEKCNPDINIEQNWGNGSGESNQSNPHWTQVDSANSRELGLSGGLTINETNILATTSKGIVVSNTDILNHLATLKNKKITREQKILARQIYDKQSQK